jgi:hypothetical protein
VYISARPERVWRHIGGFGSLLDWLPTITESELREGGRVCRLRNTNGDTIVERLATYDAPARSYSYVTVETTDYLPTLQVLDTPDGTGSMVEWSARFTPRGVSDQDASSCFTASS